MQEKRLTRNVKEKKITGVCAGIADYYSIDVMRVRVGFAASVLAGGTGAIAYAILSFVLPEGE